MTKSIPVPRELIEEIIFGPTYDRRYTQDTPVLPDVWMAYARDPGRSLGLILEPERDRRAGEAALAIRDRLLEFRKLHLKKPRTTEKGNRQSAGIAHLPGVVVLRVYFDELIHVVIPFTQWWQGHRSLFFSALKYADKTKKTRQWRLAKLADAFKYLTQDEKEKQSYHAKYIQESDQNGGRLSADMIRLAHVAGLINLHIGGPQKKERAEKRHGILMSRADSFLKLLEAFDRPIQPSEEQKIGTVFRISRNRDAVAAVDRSSVACKADAARLLFNVSCKNITWAVADSGISHRHPAFHSWREPTCGSRVIETYDFTLLRSVLSLDRDEKKRRREMEKLLKRSKGAGMTPEEEEENRPRIMEEIKKHIDELLNRVDQGFDVDWALLEPFIRMDQKDLDELPVSDHGTHVAGIIGADWPDPDLVDSAQSEEEKDNVETQCTLRLNDQDMHEAEADAITLSVKATKARHRPITDDSVRKMIGMCPDIRLIDLRVLRRDRSDDDDIRSDEFEVMAALQFIRFLNSRAGQIKVHGVNLSLSIEHDLASYACGRTPVCVECEEVVSSGVVVVAAAGNAGYRKDTGNYQVASISDPGNAAKVITVGATHRYKPHEYGVSYFSSRGPTGDGRSKPDLVAPGEKINAPVRLTEQQDKDGTSMAAPHVSGAAAMLMARHPELIGNPEKIKEILCSTATDLGRERYYQGNGMLDVLRALQSV